MTSTLLHPFEPTGLGDIIFRDRYIRGTEETWDGASRRVAVHVAQAEENGKAALYAERFYEQIVTNKFCPAGRIWYGAGRPKAQLLNCYVVPTADSREGWGKTSSDVIIISGLMGGIGINVSPVRPRGSYIAGTGGYATGAVSLMQLINGVGDVLVGGGGRRVALMLCLDITHPDLEEFLDAKLDLEQLKNANISVVIPKGFDSAEFVRLVREGGDIELSFKGIPSGKTIPARDLWARLVHNAWRSGEPGVLNGDLANRMSNILEPLISTNPCGEIWLSAYDACDLGALVLPRFVQSDGDLDWDALDESVRLGVRFLDNVLTVNHYPLPEIAATCERLRRLGLGVMGLHTMLLEMGLTYDSPESFAVVDKLFAFIKNTAYDASINLAIEKGPFPGFDQRFLDGGFAKTLKRGIRNKIKEHGIRNCALMTVAPTGTTSMVSGVSSGIEPYPPAVYWRHFYKPVKDGTKVLNKELVVERELLERFPDTFQSAIDVPVRSHFEMQKVIQAHVDNAVSKTINLAEDFPEDAFGDIWLEYLPYLKGTTVYRYGSRENEPISPLPREEWPAELRSGASAATADELLALDCPDGVCEVQYN